jgi:hypothetical protein
MTREKTLHSWEVYGKAEFARNRGERGIQKHG